MNPRESRDKVEEEEEEVEEVEDQKTEWIFISHPIRSHRLCFFFGGGGVQKGLATFRGSTKPVRGSRNSFQLIGSMVLPTSEVAMMTPNSLRAVDR